MSGKYWLESLAVGIDKFDTEHRAFFEYLDSIEQALAGANWQAALQIAERFQMAAMQHDLEEEAFLRRNKYPQINTIVQSRETLQHQISGLIDALREGGSNGIEAAQKMRHELVVYLLRGDINYKSFVDALRDENRLRP